MKICLPCSICIKVMIEQHQFNITFGKLILTNIIIFISLIIKLLKKKKYIYIYIDKLINLQMQKKKKKNNNKYTKINTQRAKNEYLQYHKINSFEYKIKFEKYSSEDFCLPI